MASASGFSTTTTFCYLIASMGLQFLWSFGLAAACSSAGVIILLSRDTNFCRVEKQLACSMFKISVALAFVSWYLLAISSFVMFWLLASV
ncbi:hypothetical protein RHGRI_021024 [Rhododendron griersonianum]|uniref:CASP-like protein n=1 Tax=Rhododendron griersonianum TaxID=479676 RepID=A0AAV6JMK0_9ERIC|nr:hypothetical protein RHGRI_021024 [Rhododendron griersonianum]